MSQAPLTVAIIIAQDIDGKFLLQMRDGNASNALRWCFFSGSIEPGETPLAGAMREFEEETGIRMGSMHFSPAFVYDTGPRKNIRHVFRLQTPISWRDIALAEGAGAGFFTRDEVVRLMKEGKLSDWMASCLKRCWKTVPKPGS